MHGHCWKNSVFNANLLVHRTHKYDDQRERPRGLLAPMLQWNKIWLKLALPLLSRWTIDTYHNCSSSLKASDMVDRWLIERMTCAMKGVLRPSSLSRHKMPTSRHFELLLRNINAQNRGMSLVAFNLWMPDCCRYLPVAPAYQLALHSLRINLPGTGIVLCICWLKSSFYNISVARISCKRILFYFTS